MSIEPWKQAHKDVVSRLPFLRTRVGLSMHQLSTVSGVTWHNIKMIEDGKIYLTVRTAFKLAPHLDCTPAYLLFGI